MCLANAFFNSGEIVYHGNFFAFWQEIEDKSQKK